MKAKILSGFLVAMCAIMLFVTPASAAAEYVIPLYNGSGTPVTLYLNTMDASGVYSVNGVMGSSKNIMISGTCYFEGLDLRFGLTLHNAMDGYTPVSWEFLFSFVTYTGSGDFQWLTNGEQTGSLTFTLTPPVVYESQTEGADMDLRSMGIE